MSDYQMFEAVVRDVEQITPLVKRFTLVSPTGAPLPAFSGGSHIIVQMQDGEQRYSNAYSLMSSPLDTTSWQIAVRLESPSKGGSRFMHQRVRPGDTLTVSTPNNLFAIEPQARKHLLIAGGIGITPFLSHIPELEQRQATGSCITVFTTPTVMLSSIRFALRHGAIGSMFMYQRSAAVSTYRACSPTSSQEPTCIPAAQRRLTRR